MSPLWTFLPLVLALLSVGTPWRFRGLSLFLGMAGLAWGVLGRYIMPPNPRWAKVSPKGYLAGSKRGA